ncbi:MAG TPA: hypothetical protein VLB67_11820 [Acidimicrobiia bacterium]|nr:hypothetical protein [Acidimicrobiia bacterium]
MKGSWGWRVRSTPNGGGRFFCPLEGGDREYQRSEVRRWLAPFGMPLLRSHQLGDYIRCSGCRQTFTAEVLEILTTAEMSARLERAAVSLLSTIVVRSGDSDLSRVAAERELRRFVRHPFAAHVAFEPPPLSDVVEIVASAAVHMDHLGRKDLLAAAVRVAHVHGSITSAAFATLHAAGGALRLPMTTVRSLIVTAGATAD